MILTTILHLIEGILLLLINLLPECPDIVLPSDIVAFLNNLIAMAGYFVPMTDIAVMLTIFTVVTNFRFFYNLFCKIYQFLPIPK